MPYPRYTTFRDDELVAAIRPLIPTGQPVPDAQTLRQGGGAARSDQIVGGNSPSPATGSRRIKEHQCSVNYPDGAEGTCRYVRIAPDYHYFQFRHHGTIEERKGPAEQFLSGAALPTQRFGERFENSGEAIEAKAREFAPSAFAEAIRHEQQDRFRRAAPPFGKKPDATGIQFSAKRAKEIGGKYALCRRVGMNLLPDSPLFDTIAEANSAWESRNAQGLFIACACRWTRRWELPRFNPLYRDHPELRDGAT